MDHGSTRRNGPCSHSLYECVLRKGIDTFANRFKNEAITRSTPAAAEITGPTQSAEAARLQGVGKRLPV